MGVRAARNDGMKRKMICIFFMAMLIQPSSALIVRAGLLQFLSGIDMEELREVISEMTWELDTAMEENAIYWPGLLARTTFPLSTGETMMFMVVYWNTRTCNLGRGGEVQNPIASISGKQFRHILFDLVMPSIKSLVFHFLGYGFAVHENISVFYFPTSVAATLQPPDNDPASHQHPLDPSELDSLKSLSSYRSAIFGNDSALPTGSNSSLSLTSYNTTNRTNVTIADRPRKFPVDSNGDCDLPSLVLMWAFAPYYDDTSSHGIQLLNPTDKIWSPNTRFYLVMQLDCNLVLYDIEAQISLWASGTDNEGSVCYAALTMYGELVVYDTDPENILWRSRTWCSSNGGECWTQTILEVQDDGNLVLYIAETEDVLWASNTVQCEGGCRY